MLCGCCMHWLRRMTDKARGIYDKFKKRVTKDVGRLKSSINKKRGKDGKTEYSTTTTTEGGTELGSRISDGELDNLSNRSIKMKVEKWAKRKDLPDWAVKQLVDELIEIKKSRAACMNEHERRKKEMLNKYESKHWIVTGAAEEEESAAPVREDDLLNTPFPYAKVAVHGEPRKKGKGRKKSSGSLSYKNVLVVQHTITEAGTANSELQKVSEQVEKRPDRQKGTQAKIESKELLQIGPSKTPKPFQPPAPKPAPPSPKSETPEASTTDTITEDAGNLNQLVQVIFSGSKPRNLKESLEVGEVPEGVTQDKTSESSKSIEERTEQNTVVNMALTAPSPPEIEMVKKHRRTKKPGPHIDFKSEVVFVDFSYAEEGSNTKPYSVALKEENSTEKTGPGAKEIEIMKTKFVAS